MAVSEAVARYVESFPEAAGKVSVHPNGVDEARFNPSCRPVFEQFSEFTIGFVGSLKPWHGLETLADAFALVRESMPGARLLIVGSGPVRDPLVDRLRRAGSLPYCTFTGKVEPDKIPGLLAGMDVGVAPALPQSPSGDYFSPLKLFEYMAVGLPVVCSRSGQMKEIVSNGENGLLFEPGRAEDLAEKLIGLGRDRNLRERLGAAAHRSVVENHTWRAVVTNILQTIDTSHVTSRVG